jgi:hypothetical protein
MRLDPQYVRPGVQLSARVRDAKDAISMRM